MIQFIYTIYIYISQLIPYTHAFYSDTIIIIVQRTHISTTKDRQVAVLIHNPLGLAEDFAAVSELVRL